MIPGRFPDRCLVVLIVGWLSAAASLAHAIDLDVFDQRFQQLLTEDGVPGGAYAVINGADIVRAAGHGRRSGLSQQPVTPETVFRLASVSKTFAAQLTALLVDEGWLSWDEPIVRHVPDFTLADPGHASDIRLHHLLGQSGGIVPNAYDNLLNASQSMDRILPQFASVKSMCRPGQCYTYQNVLFSLIEPAIETTTGSGYEQLLAERLFVPLGMAQASSGLAGYQAADNRALPHVRSSRRLPWVPTQVNANYYQVAPAAGINASVLDLGRWLSAQMGHAPDVLRPDLIRQLTEPRVRTVRDLRRRGWRDLLSDAHYGLGWRVYQVGDETIYLHSGWVRGFVADIAYSQERQIGLAVLLNAESSVLNEITTTFWREVLSEPLPVTAGEHILDMSPEAELVPALGGD